MQLDEESLRHFGYGVLGIYVDSMTYEPAMGFCVSSRMMNIS